MKQCNEHFSLIKESLDLGAKVFQTTRNDNKLTLSMEDKQFLTMERDMHCNDKGNWVAPLPFRTPRKHLPNNREQALAQLKSLSKLWARKPVMKVHFVDFMDKMLWNNHAELAPPMKEEEECWYLPFFGVYHPQKPGQIWVVFDSSAYYNGYSLNKILLTGPDLSNSLLGVLIRFRKETVAILADIQQMFYSSLVRDDHRNYLYFLWFSDGSA